MRSSTYMIITLLVALTLPSGAIGGDRDGVSESLASIRSTWPEALFSIEVSGADDGQAVLNRHLEIAYEAELPGYVAYLVVSSHGDITLYRDSARTPKTRGVEGYLVRPPLGSGQIIVLFANAPWDSFFPDGGTVRQINADRDGAAAFVQQLAQEEDAHVLVSDRRYQFTTAAAPGGTEYTARGIVMQVQQAQGPTGSGGAARIPSRIEFEFDSDRLTAQGKLDLDTFGEALVTELREVRVALEGHTDSIGTDEYNKSLSERRARSARQYLLDSFGIPDSRLTAVGMGKSDPIAPNDDELGRSRNRRVDFIFSAATRPPTATGN